MRKRDAKLQEKNEEIKDDQPEMNPAKNLEGPNIAFVVPLKPLITMAQLATLYATQPPVTFKLEYLQIKSGQVHGRRILSQYVIFFYKIED